jgi:Flp pilus assembly protein TadG
MHRLFRARRTRPERGAVAVEFALIFIPFIVLVFGLIQYGWYFYVASTTSGAASNVARRLEVGDCWTGSQAEDLAQLESPSIRDGGLTKTPTTLTGAVPGTTQITVTVNADANIVGFLPMPNGGIVTRTVQARLEDDAEGASCLPPAP